MMCSLFELSYLEEVVELFQNVFSTSEGVAQGQSIGNLVINLINNTDQQDLIGLVALDSEKIVGSIFFSRITVPSNRTIFMLSPVAVCSDVQNTGIGQQLILYGLDYLRAQAIDIVITYGDPAFYSKTNFQKISQDVIKAPFTLSQPIGWLAQALNDRPLKPIQGSIKCVEAFNDPKYW